MVNRLVNDYDYDYKEDLAGMDFEDAEALLMMEDIAAEEREKQRALEKADTVLDELESPDEDTAGANSSSGNDPDGSGVETDRRGGLIYDGYRGESDVDSDDANDIDRPRWLTDSAGSDEE